MARQDKAKSGRGAKSVDSASQKSDATEDLGGRSAELFLYQEKPGVVPYLEFLRERKPAERVAVRAAIQVLDEKGHELRPPANEHLGDRLFYLRITSVDGTYRLFYWPFGRGIVILGHGFSKKSGKCPPSELERAERCRKRFEADPVRHTYPGGMEEEDDA